MNLTILRHAQSVTNAVKKGQLYIPDTPEGKELQKIHPTSAPLSKLGIEQAQITGQQMAEHDLQFDFVFCSPLARTVQTLDIIKSQYQDAGKKMVTKSTIMEPRIREIDFGNVAWMTKSQAKAYFPWFKFYESRDWHSKPELREGFFYDRTPSGGESYADVYLRVSYFLISLAIISELEPHSKILLVTHGGTARIIRMILEEKLPKDFERDLLIWRYRNCDFISYLDGEFSEQYSFVR